MQGKDYKKNKRVYILGAGSSIGHSENRFSSIKDFFSMFKDLNPNIRNEYGEVIEYSKNILGKDVLKEKINIEELFTHIEIELERRSSSDLLEIQRQLFKLIQTVLISLGKEIPEHKGDYGTFVAKLKSSDTIISFNWDLLLDNYLCRKFLVETTTPLKTMPIGQDNARQYYNFFFHFSAHGERTIHGISISDPYTERDNTGGYYLKLHGSIDWFYCANDGCRAFRKVFPCPRPEKTYYCSECHEPLLLLLIPPVLNKNYRQYPIIRRMWNMAAEELSSATELVIWGYSLPVTDFYSSWLLRQARLAPINKLIVINPAVISKKGNITLFVKRIKNIYLGKLKKENVELYSTYKDYIKGIKIKQSS